MTDYLLSNDGFGRLLSGVDADDTIFYLSAEDAAKLPEPGVGQAFALTLWDGDQAIEIVYCTANPLTGTLIVTRAEESTTAKAWLAGTETRNAITKNTAGAILQQGFITNNLASQLQAEGGTDNATLMSPLRTQQFFEKRTTAFMRDEFLTKLNAAEARRALGWETTLFSGTGLESTFVLPSTDYDTPYTRVYVDEIYKDTGYTITGDQLVFDVPPAAGTDNIVVVLGENFAFSVSFPGNNTVSTDALVNLAVTTPKLADLAVTNGKLANKAATYGKIQDISATDKVLGRATAGSGSIEELTCTSFGRAVLAAATLAAQQAVLTSTGWPVPTGKLGYFIRTSAPTGWVDAWGQIGNAASGASTRANADTEALFTEIWNGTSATVYDSAGNTVAKGASAAADFAANRRIAVPDMRGEFLRGLDVGRGVDASRALGSAQAELVGPHAHIANFAGNALSGHAHTTTAIRRHGANGSSGVGLSDGDTTNTASSLNTDSVSAGTPSGSVTVNSNGTAENRPRNTALRPCFKL